MTDAELQSLAEQFVAWCLETDEHLSKPWGPTVDYLKSNRIHGCEEKHDE